MDMKNVKPVIRNKMAKIEIREVLSRIIEVDCKIEEDAKEQVEQEWKDGVHVLGGDDFQDVSFHIIYDE